MIKTRKEIRNCELSRFSAICMYSRKCVLSSKIFHCLGKIYIAVSNYLNSTLTQWRSKGEGDGGGPLLGGRQKGCKKKSSKNFWVSDKNLEGRHIYDPLSYATALTLPVFTQSNYNTI